MEPYRSKIPFPGFNLEDSFESLTQQIAEAKEWLRVHGPHRSAREYRVALNSTIEARHRLFEKGATVDYKAVSKMVAVVVLAGACLAALLKDEYINYPFLVNHPFLASSLAVASLAGSFLTGRFSVDLQRRKKVNQEFKEEKQILQELERQENKTPLLKVERETSIPEKSAADFQEKQTKKKARKRKKTRIAASPSSDQKVSKKPRILVKEETKSDDVTKEKRAEVENEVAYWENYGKNLKDIYQPWKLEIILLKMPHRIK